MKKKHKLLVIILIVLVIIVGCVIGSYIFIAKQLQCSVTDVRATTLIMHEALTLDPQVKESHYKNYTASIDTKYKRFSSNSLGMFLPNFIYDYIDDNEEAYYFNWPIVVEFCDTLNIPIEPEVLDFDVSKEALYTYYIDGLSTRLYEVYQPGYRFSTYVRTCGSVNISNFPGIYYGSFGKDELDWPSIEQKLKDQYDSELTMETVLTAASLNGNTLLVRNETLDKDYTVEVK